MKYHRLRWALLCVAATYGALQATSAEASHIVVIKPGDSMDSLARKHHVAKRDIARANGISVDALLIDGKRLIIPDPPKAVVKEPTMSHAAAIRGDRVTIRLGPDEGYRRLTLLDRGAPVVVTRKAGDWFQIRLENGQTGWVRSDFIGLGKTRQAAEPPADRKKTKRVAASSADRKAAKRRRHQDIAREESHRHKRRTQAAEHREKRRKKSRVAAARRHRHTGRSAALARRRTRPESEPPDTDSDIIRTAYAYRGVPYHYGGSSRSGFDCSGFTRHIYAHKGIHLPHSASEQFHQGSKVSGSEMKPGDLVFFSTTRRGISHVGIYAGDGKFVHASSGGGRVRVDTLRSGYYKNRFRGARRVR